MNYKSLVDFRSRIAWKEIHKKLFLMSSIIRSFKWKICKKKVQVNRRSKNSYQSLNWFSIFSFVHINYLYLRSNWFKLTWTHVYFNFSQIYRSISFPVLHCMRITVNIAKMQYAPKILTCLILLFLNCIRACTRYTARNRRSAYIDSFTKKNWTKQK